MSQLKAVLKRNINHNLEEDLCWKISEILTDFCPTDLVWDSKDNVLYIEINIDEQSKREQEQIIEFIEGLVGCSYISDFSDNDRVLTLSFTLSTLIDKLSDVNEDGYVPVKIDRFVKRQDKNSIPSKQKQVYIVDNKVLSDDVFTRPDWDGVIFVADTQSEWVNHEIADAVLKLLNTTRSYTQMIDNCINKERKIK